MDLHHLEYIIEIANMHRISRAAENLHITQSTLSQYLSKLESELGMRLFDRRQNEMALTAAGRLYVDTCRQILQEKKDLYHQLAELSESKTGHFTVGLTPQWGAVAYSHIIGPFHKLYPNVKISTKEEIAVPLMQMLQDGQIDMAIIPLAENVSLTQESLFLHAEELILAIPKKHAADLPFTQTNQGLPSIDIAALSHEPMIFSQTQTTIRKLEEQCFSSCHIFPHIIVEINSHPASLNMVEQGIGSTFLPRSCAVPSKHIVYAHASPLVQWFVVIAFRRGFTPRQSENYFITLAKDYFNSLTNTNIL